MPDFQHINYSRECCMCNWEEMYVLLIVEWDVCICLLSPFCLKSSFITDFLSGWFILCWKWDIVSPAINVLFLFSPSGLLAFVYISRFALSVPTYIYIHTQFLYPLINDPSIIIKWPSLFPDTVIYLKSIFEKCGCPRFLWIELRLDLWLGRDDV